jgi:hypothetical protein
MTELTLEKIRLVALAIQAMRLRGELQAGEPVSFSEMERISIEQGVPLTARTFANFEAIALRKARHAALAKGAWASRTHLQSTHSP